MLRDHLESVLFQLGTRWMSPAFVSHVRYEYLWLPGRVPFHLIYGIGFLCLFVFFLSCHWRCSVEYVSYGGIVCPLEFWWDKATSSFGYLITCSLAAETSLRRGQDSSPLLRSVCPLLLFVGTLWLCQMPGVTVSFPSNWPEPWIPGHLRGPSFFFFFFLPHCGS